MKKIIRTISRAVQVVLLAPVKLPAKALSIIKYVALGLGIIESVIDDEDALEKEMVNKEQEQEGGRAV